MGTILGRDALLAAAQSETKTINVDLGEYGTALVRVLPIGRALDIRLGGHEKKAIMALLIVASVVNEDLSPVFFESDMPAILQFPSSVAEPLMEAINALNGFSKTSEIEKNSEASPNTDLASVSPLISE